MSCRSQICMQTLCNAASILQLCTNWLSAPKMNLTPSRIPSSKILSLSHCMKYNSIGLDSSRQKHSASAAAVLHDCTECFEETCSSPHSSSGGPWVGSNLKRRLHSTLSLENLSSGENLAGCALCVGDPSGAIFCRQQQRSCQCCSAYLMRLKGQVQ